MVRSSYLDDEALGVKTLEQHHGVTIVQLPAGAEANSMPLTEIRRDKPDVIVRD